MCNDNHTQCKDSPSDPDSCLRLTCKFYLPLKCIFSGAHGSWLLRSSQATGRDKKKIN